MNFNYSNDFIVIRRLAFRIELVPPGADAPLSEKELVRSLGENYPFCKMKVEGDTATFAGLDGNGEPASFDFSGASAYRYSFGALVDQGGPVVVQLGLRSAGELDPPHLRVIIDECARKDRRLLVWLMRYLAALCGEPGPFDESRITVEHIDAAFFLDKRTIEEVEPVHQSTLAGALETMVDAEGRICGFQIGQHLDAHEKAEMPCTATRRQVLDIAMWEQTREFALHSVDLFREGHPGVLLRAQLRGAFSLKSLSEKNLLAGLELTCRNSRDPEKRLRVGVDDWNTWESWARIVLETSAVGARD
ncbi:hypothetical protein [Variovorax sp. OV700]|uniref:hypothetical protein n=1 Tax=Variovorax sp. OV700 TaxID=1882826 RepID=UPI00088BD097|nr:hypothetical protein [Variovorax sp. OV700]SDI16948.1 hypothetical protein SAMN05444748_1044 [Variovorax sp. OV700]